jgi:hypothetical protein
MKVMVCHFVSDSHEVMTALIVVLPIILVVEISLQLHQALSALYFQRGGMKIQLLYQMLSDFLGIKQNLQEVCSSTSVGFGARIFYSHKGMPSSLQ